MMVFISNGKNYVPAYSGRLHVLTTFLLKEFYAKCLNRVVMLRSHIILRAFVKLNWWDVYWVNELVGSWVWIFPVG